MLFCFMADKSLERLVKEVFKNKEDLYKLKIYKELDNYILESDTVSIYLPNGEVYEFEKDFLDFVTSKKTVDKKMLEIEFFRFSSGDSYRSIPHSIKLLNDQRLSKPSRLNSDNVHESNLFSFSLCEIQTEFKLAKITSEGKIIGNYMITNSFKTEKIINDLIRTETNKIEESGRGFMWDIIQSLKDMGRI